MTREEEIEALKRKLEARRDKPGFEANVRAIEARLRELEDEA